MEKIEQYFTSSDKITNLRTVTWIPENDIKGVVVISHGVTEHIDRYEELAKVLTKQGYVVAGHDHIGHGKSTNVKKMYFGEKGSFNYVVEDIKLQIQNVKEKYKDKKITLIGFSLGSFAARQFLIDNPYAVNSAVLIGTGYNNDAELKIAKFAAWNEARKHGDSSFTDLINKLTFGTYNKAIKNPKTNLDWLCKNEKELEKYMNDPLRGEAMSCGLFRELLNGMSYSNNINNIKKMNKNMPVLLMSGTEDPVGNYLKGVTKVYELFKSNGINDVELKTYDNARHDLLHEECKKEIFKDLVEFINLKNKTNDLTGNNKKLEELHELKKELLNNKEIKSNTK